MAQLPFITELRAHRAIRAPESPAPPHLPQSDTPKGERTSGPARTHCGETADLPVMLYANPALGKSLRTAQYPSEQAFMNVSKLGPHMI